MLLTPEFGPRLRIGVILAEMEFEPDPIYDGPNLCNKCMACVNNCPGNAISKTRTMKVILAGHEIEYGEQDCDACDVAFRGAELTKDGKVGTYLPGRKDAKSASCSPFYNKPINLYNSGQAVCGVMGCTRACMISLEARCLLKNKFKQPFRCRKLWRVDWSDYEPVENTNMSLSDLGSEQKRKLENAKEGLKASLDPNAQQAQQAEATLSAQHDKEAE